MPPDDPAWRLRRTHEFGRRLLFRWNDGHRLLVASRSAIVALGALLGLAVYAAARRRWGPAAGLAALVLCAFNPDLRAHSRLVTTDLGAALFIFVAVLAWERLAERATAARLLAAGAATGAAFAAKFSALVLVPVLGVLALLVVLPRAPARFFPGGLDPRLGGPRGARVRRLAIGLPAMAVVAVLVVWSAYGFEGDFSPDPAVSSGFDWTRLEPEPGLVRGAVRVARAASLLPDPYLYGFLRFYRHSEARPAFLLGRRSDTGFPHFFLVSFAVKTPLGLIALLALAAALALRPLPGLARAGPFVWVPVAVYAALTLTRGINIGHRHLLPLYPFLFVLAARCFAWARLRWRDGARVPSAAVGALAAWAVASALLVHPHDLAYFNEAAGGPRNGYRLLVDSSLDWGQDLIRAREWAERRGQAGFKLSYFGTADPEYYRVPALLLPGYMAPVPRKVVREVRAGDLVAVSATNLQCVYVEPAACPLMERLRAGPPFDRIGWSILVYRPDFGWTIADPGTAAPAASPDLPADAEGDAQQEE
jgi:hypothetical protein